MRVCEAVELYQFGIVHLSESYQQWVAARLKQFVGWCDLQDLQVEQLTTADIRRYINYQATKTTARGKLLSSHTVHGHARAVRAFLNWCSREDGLSDLVSEKVARRIGMPHLEEKIVEVFSGEQIKALFAACDREFLPKLRWRDRAILSVLLDTGICADELCGLTLDDCLLAPDNSFVRVLGKGNKWREVGLGKKARQIVHRYIMLYRKSSQRERHVFLNRFDQSLTVNGLDQLLARLGGWAAIDRCYPHRFRHTFACRYLLGGGDVKLLSLLMGHTSVNVTERYLKAIKATQALHVSQSVLDNL
jgi:integrase/recombinase XerD